jgi:transcriptional regulator with XRE-family HTH domain
VEIEDSLASRIREARAASRLTLKELAQRISVTDSAISQWETGRTLPSTEKLIQFSQATGADLRWLRTGIKPHLTEFKVRDIPICTLAEAARETFARKLLPTNVVGKLRSHFPCSRAAFAISIFDDLNLPRFSKDDIIVVDPLVMPARLDFALACKADHTLVFGQIRAFQEGPGELLRETSPRYEPLLDNDDPKEVELRQRREIASTPDEMREALREELRYFARKGANQLGGRFISELLRLQAQKIDSRDYGAVCEFTAGTETLLIASAWIVGVMTEHTRPRARHVGEQDRRKE